MIDDDARDRVLDRLIEALAAQVELAESEHGLPARAPVWNIWAGYADDVCGRRWSAAVKFSRRNSRTRDWTFLAPFLG